LAEKDLSVPSVADATDPIIETYLRPDLHVYKNKNSYLISYYRTVHSIDYNAYTLRYTNLSEIYPAKGMPMT